MQVTIEKPTASMVYPVLTKVNNGDNDNAKKVFNNIPKELIALEVAETLRELARKITDLDLSSDEEFEKYVNKLCQGGFKYPNSPQDFVRKLLSL